MDGVQLRDEAGQDRVRAAVEFLDPSEFPVYMFYEVNF
jgi:DNA replication licensing factor MCM3